MTRKLVTDTVTLPAHWAPALVNGDMSSLTPRDAARLDNWRANAGLYGWHVLSDDGEGRYTNHYRLYGGDADGGMVLDYVIGQWQDVPDTAPFGRLSSSDRDLCSRWIADDDCTPALVAVARTGFIADEEQRAQLVEDLTAAIDACNDLLEEVDETSPEYDDYSDDAYQLTALRAFIAGEDLPD